MKAFLMHRDHDLNLAVAGPPNEPDLVQDLELTTLFDAMAQGDQFLGEVAARSVLSSLRDPADITYRQDVLKDCLQHPVVIKEMYDIAVESIVGEKKIYGPLLVRHPSSVLHRSVQVLEFFVTVLKRLRHIADEHAAEFRSAGLVRFFSMLTDELDDEYFARIDEHLKRLQFRRGVLISAELGRGLSGTGYVLREPEEIKQSWVERVSSTLRPGLSFTIADRDEAGAKALGELRDRGINLVANSLAQSTDHILSFFQRLRSELGFYVGCLNVYSLLAEKGEPTCFPVAVAGDVPVFSGEGLIDACLAVSVGARLVGNDVEADRRSLVMITGANQGGKSTFLRSVGLAQLMMQCGMFVAARSFSANICTGIFTHYKREEDASMNRGKFEEELSRMSDITDQMRPGSLVLFNESFAATNSREGSEIARQIIRALLGGGMKIVFVTHLFDLADAMYRTKAEDALFLRAERVADGERTYKLVLGEPLPTSYGEDVYRRVFGADPRAESPD